MENQDVEQHFARQAGEYEALMARIIPWYGPGHKPSGCPLKPSGFSLG